MNQGIRYRLNWCSPIKVYCLLDQEIRTEHKTWDCLYSYTRLMRWWNGLWLMIEIQFWEKEHETCKCRALFLPHVLLFLILLCAEEFGHSHFYSLRSSNASIKNSEQNVHILKHPSACIFRVSSIHDHQNILVLYCYIQVLWSSTLY